MDAIAILTIGDELTSGRVVDTNAASIARDLGAAGVEARIHLTCGDSVADIVRCLRLCHEVSDIVVVTGGLGPTTDDLTHAAVAQYAGVERVLYPDEMDRIRAKFSALGLPMPESNALQATLPAGATVIPNEQGLAPGCFVEANGKWVVTLPGVPREMQPMLRDSVVPFVMERLGIRGALRVRILKTFGLTESRLESIVSAIPLPAPGLRIGYRPTFPEVHVSLTAVAPDGSTADRWVEQFEAQVRAKVGKHVWGVDADEFPGVVGALLRERGYRLAIAESCTGGLIAKLVTDVPGSSDYFERGFVTYTNEAKVELLGVDPVLFAPDGPGAVSERCVLQMARGARSRSGASVAVATSGIAGPAGGTAEKPVGTVWIGLATPEGESARRFSIPGERDWVRTLSAYIALERLRRFLVGLPDEERGYGRAKAAPVGAG